MTFIFTLLWIVLNLLFVKRCRETELKVDETQTTPSDFAIILFGLPEETQKEDIEAMLEHKRDILRLKHKFC